jgi:dihydroxyacetone kinase-like protein
MKKIINNAENFVEEFLQGIYIAHKDMISYTANDIHCAVGVNKTPGKTGIATGGGSGHLPLFIEYIGRGMLDGCAVGDVFQSPSAEQMLEVTKAIDSGAGVLYIYGNYNGDIFNFDMAAEMADMEEGIRVKTVIVGDDVSAPKPINGEKSVRRGVAGLFFVYKCAGAAAADMLSLDEVARVAGKARDKVHTMGVALSPCIVPRVGKAGFSIGDDEMEIGMGIHGETGIRRGKLESADSVVEEMMRNILADFEYKKGDEVAILVNGLGATPLEEQYLAVRRIDEILSSNGLIATKYYVGEYATSLEMAGFSISVIELDDELEKYLSAPAETPVFKQL